MFEVCECVNVEYYTLRNLNPTFPLHIRDVDKGSSDLPPRSVGLNDHEMFSNIHFQHYLTTNSYEFDA